MTTAIQFLRSNVAGLRPAPVSLADGMPMINFNPQDPGLYFKANDNTLIKIGPTFVGSIAPNTNPSGFAGFGIGEMWLDTDTSLGILQPRPILKIWSGAAWVAAGGDILKEEIPQAARTFFAGPVSGPDELPTFRLLGNDDLPDDLDYHKLQGGEVEGGLLIGGGTPGWEVANLTMGPGLTQSVGPNMITLEVTAGDIAADGQPGANFDQGDGHIQLNYDGKFTGDSRLKFINKPGPAGSETFLALVNTELGNDPLTHTHIIKGDTTLSGNLTLTDVYDLGIGGDLTVGHNATFGAGPVDLFQVYGTTTFYEDVTVDGLNDLTVGGDIIGTNNLTVGTGDTNTHTLTGDIFLSGNTTIGRTCVDDINVLGTSVFECLATFNEGIVIPGDKDLVVGGDVLFGTDCNNTIGMQGTQYNKCDVLIGENVPTPGAEQIYLHADTGLAEFKQNVNISGDLQIGDNLPTGWNVVIDGTNGDITSEGTITAEYFVGDGSQLTNLAVPNAMLFHGDIDATVGPVPANPDPGDFYLHIGPSTTVVANWPNIGGDPIQQDQFIYFYDDGLGGKWALGSVQNQQGFVTINTAQDINGSKTFKDHTQFDETVTVADDKKTTLGGQLEVEKETQLNNTLTVAPSYDTTLGGDLSVAGDATIGSGCTNILDIKAETFFQCGLTIGDPNNPCVGNPFNVYSLTNIYCSTIIFNTFEVAGNYSTTLGGTLLVQGFTQINNALTVQGNYPTSLGGTLQVDGDTTLNARLSVGGKTHLYDTLTVEEATQLNETLTVAADKATTLGGTLTVQKATQLNDTLTVAADKATTLGGTLTVAANKATTLGGTLTVQKATQLNETLTVAADKATTLGGTLTVADAKKTTLGGDLQVKQNTVIGSSCANTLQINAVTTFLCGLTIGDPANPCGTGNFNIYSPTNIYCPETVFNTLTVSGNFATTLGGTLAVTGNVSVNTNKFNITAASGNTAIAGTLNVVGNTTVNTNKFVVTAATGNTVIAGTLAVQSNAVNALAVTGKAQSASTVSTDNGKTLVTLDYIKTTGPGGTGTFGYWSRTGTTLSPANATDSLSIAGNFTVNTNKFTVASGTGNTVIAGTLAVQNNGATALAITGKATSASTATGDGGSTLVTKDYLTGTAGTGTGKFGYWSRTGTVVSLANAGDTVSIVSNSASALNITGKAQSASTLATDPDKTLVTLDYVKANSGLWEVSGGNITPRVANVGQNVVPRSDGNASLGTAALRWANLYTQDMHFSNEGTAGNDVDGTTGNWTLQEGNDYIYFINNKTGVKFRVVMEQV